MKYNGPDILTNVMNELNFASQQPITMMVRLVSFQVEADDGGWGQNITAIILRIGNICSCSLALIQHGTATITSVSSNGILLS